MGQSGNPAKRAAQETPEPVVYDRAESADEFGTEDFDAFWSSRDRKARQTNIMGHRVTLPAALPLQFEMEARRLQKSKNIDDIKRLVGILMGSDALDAWVSAGLDYEQFAVLLAWLPRVIVGEDITLAQVAAMLEDAEATTPDPS